MFIGNECEVYLVGEGYFLVIKDKECLFIVKMNFVFVSVFGMEFNINVYLNIDKVVIILEEGFICMLLNCFDLFYLLELDD